MLIFSKKTDCNEFWLGHLGISNLFWFDGFDVINIEPGEAPNSYNSRWLNYHSISEVSDSSIDLIYGSHSLEHVQDIELFKSEVRRVLRPNGFLFWEVPNAKFPGNGAMNNRIDIPHTYYFEKKFFKNWFDEILIIETFSQSHNSGIVSDWSDYTRKNGSVIRALGRMM